MKDNSKKSVFHQISIKRRIIFSIITAFMVLAIVFVIGELSIRIFHPQRYMYPRYKFSQKYGAMLFENCIMINACPGRWRFNYTINEYQYRGKPILISNSYDKKNIIIIGDSNSFGIGVNDGEEYPAIMAEKLKSNYNIINLSVGGWGLTQQIRRYYEFGQLYFPEVVLLQFCSNDPEDNFNNKVTIIKDGRFIFQNSNNTINFVKKYLSKSFIQKSQIYNLFRDAIYQYFRREVVKEAKSTLQKEYVYNKKIPVNQVFYNSLLEFFAEDLNYRGVKLLMIDGNDQLDQFPYIKEKISILHSEGLIYYYKISPWFENVTNYSSPEGHIWGKKAHNIIGTNLSEIISRELLMEEKQNE